MNGKQIRPRLISDFQKIAEPLGDHQQNSSPFALQKRVGGHSCAHLHRANIRLRNGYIT